MGNPASFSTASTIRSSMIWNTLELGVSQVLTIVVFILLTYRLPPEIFGIFALGAFFIDFLYTQAQTAAIDVLLLEDKIAKQRLNKLYGNIASAFAIGLVIILIISFAVSQSFEEEKYKYILPIMCLCIVPIPFQIPALYLLAKKRDFKGTGIRNVIAAAFGAILALGFAFSEYPEWALVAQRIGQVVSSAVFVCLRAKFWPSFAYLFNPDLAFLAPWAKAFSSQAMIVAQSRGLDLVIASSLGVAALGILRVSMRLMEAIYGALAAPISKLWVILLPENAVQSERGKIYIDFTKIAALLLLPTFAGLLLVSDQVVPLLLDPDYLLAADILKVLCVTGLFAPLVYFRNAAFTATGRLSSLIYLSSLDVIVIVTASALLVKFGLVAATGAMLVSALIRLVIAVPILLKEFGLPYTALVRAVYPPYLAVAVMAGSLYLLTLTIGTIPMAALLALKIVVGAASFGLFLLAFHRKWLIQTIQIILPNSKN